MANFIVIVVVSDDVIVENAVKEQVKATTVTDAGIVCFHFICMFVCV